MQYLLDTNAVIALLKKRDGSVAKRVRAQRPADVGLSSIVLHELYFGASKSQQRERNLAVVDGLRFEVLAFDREDARQAGEIRVQLGAKGTRLAAMTF